jgi:UDP-3-O-[3-hydroxymyristoyl] glucosamine N-acyltransferase
MIEGAGFEALSYVHRDARIMKGVSLGKDCVVLAGAFVNCRAEIGDGCILWSNAQVEHDCSIGQYNFFAAGSIVAGHVKTGNNCFFGTNSSIRDGLEIAPFTLVGAGAYVSKSTKEYDLVLPAASVVLEGKARTAMMSL